MNDRVACNTYGRGATYVGETLTVGGTINAFDDSTGALTIDVFVKNGASYHTPQKSPPSQLRRSYRTQPRPSALFEKPSRGLLAISLTKSACTRGMSYTT